MEMTGQRVVVLGGTSGIGLATARAAADRGARVVVASGREASVQRALGQLPEGAIGHSVDVRDGASLEAFFDGLGAFDHLIYTAGEALNFIPLSKLDSETAHKFFEIRYFGALAAVRAAVSQLRSDGSITLIGGSAGQRPGPGWALAASICGAMEGLTRALALELAPVRVNLVSPGVVRSPLWGEMDAEEREQMYAAVAKSPVGHVGEVEEIAQAFMYCIEQTYASGTVIAVDGGSLLV